MAKWFAIALVAYVTVHYLVWDNVGHRFSTVVPGQVYQSAEMSPDVLVRCAATHGIRTVIDLRDDRPAVVEAERKALEGAGKRHIHIPLPHDPTRELYQNFLRQVEQCRKRGETPILVHCTHGYGRSVLAAAIYRIEFEGWSNEAALSGTARLPDAWGFASRLLAPITGFREKSRKGGFLMQWKRERG
ncbi:MAG: dual specificity protein phosphatase family protein [Planctomycetes bacterium]|nr:dual specificity protein phosphatase family protein [Planctomycetota bacterium]